MPGLGPMFILLVANFFWLLLSLFASWALKLSVRGGGANNMYWGKNVPLSVSAGRKECRYPSVMALSVWYEYV